MSKTTEGALRGKYNGDSTESPPMSNPATRWGGEMREGETPAGFRARMNQDPDALTAGGDQVEHTEGSTQN